MAQSVDPIVAGIIPARYESRRLPGKALLDINGKPMIVRVYERAKLSKRLHDLIVATDDERILEAVEKHGGKAVMTSRDCVSGTDRIVEAARDLYVDYVVNIQGDEPLIRPEMIDSLITGMVDDASVPETATLATAIKTPEEYENPNVVKVVINRQGYALYFSRAPIPFIRQSSEQVPGTLKTLPENLSVFYRHVGIYIFRKDFLMAFPVLEKSTYESIEKLEQLRVLENGYRMKVVVTPYSSIGVDTKKDYEFVCSLFQSQGNLL